MEDHIWKKQLFSIQALMFVFSFFLLEACSFQQNSQLSPNSPKGASSSKSTVVNWKLPIAIPEGKFVKAAGWLSDEQLLYITNKEQTSYMYCYHLKTGKSTLLYKSEYPIGAVQISPSKNYILIQAALSSYEAKVTVIDTHGNELDSQSIPSHELAFEWNPYNGTEVLITKFQEDWSFQVFLLNVDRKTMQQISLPQPFLKWVNPTEVAYLNWDNNTQVLFAPLILHNLTDEKDTSLFPEVYQFSAFKNMVMTITINEKEKTKATYTFYDSNFKKMYTFQIPQLTKYSDWLVPFYDYDDKKFQFMTFRPIKSSSADTYTNGFQLVLYNIKNGKNSVLLKGLDNEPISLAPSGNNCLYGNRLEKMIDLHAKKILKLVKD